MDRITSTISKAVDTSFKRLLIITAGIFILMSLLNPGVFLTLRNIESMSFQFPEMGLLAFGIMLAMLTGGIDLSLVGVANLSGIFAAIFLSSSAGWDFGFSGAIQIVTALAIALVSGFLCGLINGFLIAEVKIIPILATLGTLQLFSGIALIITKGTAIIGFPESFTVIGQGAVSVLSVPLIIFILSSILIGFILKRTKFGVDLYLTGTNLRAAVFAGIRTRLVLFKVYAINGLLAGITGFIMIARTNSAKADFGASYTLQAVLIAVLGGVDPVGGRGSVLGVIVAVLGLQFLSSGFNMLRFSMFAKEFIWGIFLLTIMVVNYFGEKKITK